MSIPLYLRREHEKLTPKALTSGAKKNSWFQIITGLQMKDEQGGGTGAEVYIYDEIGGYGILAADFVRELQAIDEPQITVRISSPGGSVFEALAIYASLKNVEAKVTCIIDGLCASAATVVAMGGDVISTAPGSMWMVHEAWGTTFGNAKDMQQMADLLNKTSANMAEIYAARAGGKPEDWRATMKAETWYTAEEAVSAGLADGLTESSKDVAAKIPDKVSASVDANLALSGAKEESVFALTPELFRQAMKEAVL